MNSSNEGGFENASQRKLRGCDASQKYLAVSMCTCVLSCFSYGQLLEILWTVTLQALLSMGFSRQEYWNGLPCAPPGDLPNPGIEPGFPALQADSLPLVPPRKPIIVVISSKNVQVQVQTFISTYDELPDNLQSSGQVPALTQ